MEYKMEMDWNLAAEKFGQPGCKESQFYSLPSGQAVASIY